MRVLVFCLVFIVVYSIPVMAADDVIVDRDPVTDRVIAIHSTTPPRTLSVGSRSIPLVSNYDAEAAAKVQLTAHKDLLGLVDPSGQLELGSVRTNEAGFNHVRYRQVHLGVPVMGEAIVHFYPDGTLQMIRTSLARDLPSSVVPFVSAGEAKRMAIEAVVETDGRGLAFVAGEPELLIVPLDMIERKTEPDSRLAWKVRVFDQGSVGKRQDDMVYLDAASGVVVHRSSNIWTAIQQYINDCSVEEPPYDCARDFPVDYGDPPVTYYHGRSYDQPPRGPFPEVGTIFDGSLDVDANFDLLAMIHDLVWDSFGLDGANNQGGILNSDPYYPTPSFVHYDGFAPDPCPGAWYWLTGNIGFCLGMVVPDVVGHEYAHAVFNGQGPSDHEYYSESGALNEAWADVFGEYGENFITGSCDWQNAENSVRGTIRDIGNPHNPDAPYFVTGLPHPDRYFDPYMYCGDWPVPEDGNGVHGKSTVVSHTFYLFAEGGEHNGCEIQGQGIEVAIQILYEGIKNYFTATETFNEAYVDLVAACASAGYAPTVCAELEKALQAVEIDQPGGYCSGNTEQAPPCAVAHGGEASTTNSTGTPSTTFGVGEDIWLALTTATPDRDLDVHLLPENAARPYWEDLGLSSIAQTNVTVGTDGNSHAPVFNATDEGQFDVIVDGNNDGFWQPWADEIVTVTVSGVSSAGNNLPLNQGLLQGVYPNPFNPRTEVYFFAKPGAQVVISVLNVRGQEVTKLFDGQAVGGRQSISWNAEGLPSGVYFVRVVSGDEVATEKVALLK